jgi:hypothetical protein
MTTVIPPRHPRGSRLAHVNAHLETARFESAFQSADACPLLDEWAAQFNALLRGEAPPSHDDDGWRALTEGAPRVAPAAWPVVAEVVGDLLLRMMSLVDVEVWPIADDDEEQRQAELIRRGAELLRAMRDREAEAHRALRPIG